MVSRRMRTLEYSCGEENERGEGYDRERKGTNLGKLPPIKIMPGIKLEDEDIVDLGIHPYPTIKAEEEEQDQSEKVTAIDLIELDVKTWDSASYL